MTRNTELNSLKQNFLLNFILLIIGGMGCPTCHSECVEVKGQRLGVNPLLPLWFPGIELGVSGLHVYLLSHLTGPQTEFLAQYVVPSRPD